METPMKSDPLELWLDTVAYSKSGSHNTLRNYRRQFQQFLAFIEKSAFDIKEEYDQLEDFNQLRKFKDRYTDYLKAWIGNLSRSGHTNGSIRSMVGVVQSFWKYSDLPLGYVPLAQNIAVYHNRDITKEEIAHILTISRPRDRAFFIIMAQSGLRPFTICKLQLKHLPDLEKGTIPCRIDVPRAIAKGKYASYWTFIGAEGVNHLKAYLKTRPNLTPESFLFVKHGTEEQPATPKAFTHKFYRNIKRLKAKGVLDYKQMVRGKPAELRLYNLRKFFKKFAGQAGSEFVEFWMGHKLKGVAEHYITRDPEFHRKLYAEKAMPYLRLETATPSETEQTIMELRKRLTDRDREIADLRREMEDLHGVKRLAEVLERSKSLDEAFQRFKRLKDKEFETN